MSLRGGGDPSFLLCTGASRGLGRAFATAISQRFGDGSAVFLLARSVEGLEETKDQILASNPSSLVVKCFPLDMTKARGEDFSRMLADVDASISFTSAIIVHNAGDIGRQGVGIKSYCDIPDEEMDLYLRLNYSSVAFLNSAFIKAFDGIRRKTVVNVSSLCALKPVATWGNYCAVKAARNMLFRVLATEEEEEENGGNSGLRVLSYSPGPVDTDLVRSFMSDPSTHKSIREMFEKLYAEGTILQPEQSASRLVKVIERDEFVSGDHVDYYDVAD